MKIFDGIYSWDGKKTENKEPIAWFPGAYHLKIFDIRSSPKDVEYLKPTLCIYSKTGDGMSISERPEKFAREICNEFSLEMEKVLWVEELQEKIGKFEVVVFHKVGRLGNNYFYRTSKREPMDSERKIIEKELADLR